MLRKLLVPTLLGLATLVTVDAAQAQFRAQIGNVRIGTGGGGNWNRGGGWYGGNNWNSGYYGNRGWYGNNWNSGFYGNRGWYPGGYYYSTPSYYYDSYPSYSYYSAPADYYVQPVQPAQSVSDVAQIRVLLSDPNARVFFNGHQTSQSGTERWFHTPPLTSGANNTYHIRATYMQNGQEVTQDRHVSVTPGGTFTVEFR